MLSLREHLEKIGIGRSEPFSYRSLKLPPDRLSEAIRAMNAPSTWGAVADFSVDEDWPENCQGVAYDGAGQWVFCSNIDRSGRGAAEPFLEKRPRALYFFGAGSDLEESHRSMKNGYTWIDLNGFANSEDSHVGQLSWMGNELYVSYFDPKSVIVFIDRQSVVDWRDSPPISEKDLSLFGVASEFIQNLLNINASQSPLVFERIVCIGRAPRPDGSLDYPEFQAVNPWDGTLYCSFHNSWEFSIHDPKNGERIDRLCLSLPLGKVQGACFSPNRHLFVSIDTRYRTTDPPFQQPTTSDGQDIVDGDDNTKFKWIFIYSALNGFFVGAIPVLALEGGENGEEMEGLCYASIPYRGTPAQIHVVLLQNRDWAYDNLLFKSYGADRPDFV